MKYHCRFCGYESDSLEDFEEDFTRHLGYWCPYCDGFSYFHEPKHRFKLLMEYAGEEMSVKPAFPTRVSPLRWPGGKSRFVGQLLTNCDASKMSNFIEPYAGGASVGLSLLLAGKIKELYLNDLDYGIYALFQVIKQEPWMLMDRIRNFTPSKRAYQLAQNVVRNGYENLDIVDAAWAILVVNRLSYSGIPFANCMSDPSARWSADTLIKRIHRIHKVGDHLHVSCMDAIQYIEEMYWMPEATIFLDPPYHAKGPSLYLESYQENDHERLAALLNALYHGMPGADMIITYDDSPQIRKMYQFPEVTRVGRFYSIAN